MPNKWFEVWQSVFKHPVYARFAQKVADFSQLILFTKSNFTEHQNFLYELKYARKKLEKAIETIEI